MTVPKLLVGVVVLSVVAAFVPAALGADRPDDRAGQIGVGAVPAAVVVHPNDRAGPLGVGPDASAVVVHPNDRAGQIGVGSVVPIAVETPVASSGIDWADPLVIAGLTALVAAAGVAIAYGVVHHRHGGAGTTGGPGRPAVTH